MTIAELAESILDTVLEKNRSHTLSNVAIADMYERGYSYKEIAEAAHVSKSSIHMLIRRGQMEREGMR